VITSTPPGAAVVLRSPQVFRVLAASLAGRLPLGSAPLALLLFGRETMTISMAGVLVGAYTAGTAIGQPLLARMADRWLQPPVMWAAAAVSTAGFAAAVTLRGPVVVTAAAALAGFGAPPFEACLRVLWKDLLNERMLHAAYTLDVTTQELIFIVGPLVTLAAVGITGPTGGLVATALVQIGGTLVFTAAPAVRRWRRIGVGRAAALITPKAPYWSRCCSSAPVLVPPPSRSPATPRPRAHARGLAGSSPLKRPERQSEDCSSLGLRPICLKTDRSLSPNATAGRA
jgi:MFS family permease